MSSSKSNSSNSSPTNVVTSPTAVASFDRTQEAEDNLKCDSNLCSSTFNSRDGSDNSIPTTVASSDTSEDDDNYDAKSTASSDDGVVAATPPILKLPPRLSLIRLSSFGSESRAQQQQEQVSCPICLDPMTLMDNQHPLVCPTRHCHFNFCMHCIESLLSSSKDDFEMASDGNAHVKIYLNCPNCRADLSSSIRDILLLRKVDTVLWLQQEQARHPQVKVVLTESQQRTQQAMTELHVQQAIQKARTMEEKFWTDYYNASRKELEDVCDVSHHFDSDDDDDSAIFPLPQKSPLRPSERNLSDSYVEEWGVEADLDQGVHSSFRGESLDFQSLGSNRSLFGNIKSNERSEIDETLFGSMEALMTHAEKVQATQWLTSGDTEQLVLAAQLMQQVNGYAREGNNAAKRQECLNRRGSLYEIVEESRQVHEKQLQQEQKLKLPSSMLMALQQQQFKSRSTPSRYNNHNRRVSVATMALEQQHQLEQQHVLEKYPLPVRMPKAVTLDLVDPTSRRFSIKFANDTWDGTVVDAYSKLSIVGTSPQNWRVERKKPQHAGVFHVLSFGRYKHHYGPIELLTSFFRTPNRVVIAHVQGQAGQQGIIKGDVVTHVNGKPFTGTVDDMMELLQEIYAQESKNRNGDGKLRLVLNAEISIAEALKRRSTVMNK